MTVEAFSYDALGGRIVFGCGARHRLIEEVSALGVERVLLVASGRDDALAAELTDQLGPALVGHFTEVAQHVPVAKAAAAVALADDVGADAVLAVGGGSAIGFGKAIALERDVRQLAVPTTYAGSEMTAIWGRTEGGHKQTGTDPRVKPDVVIYDPELTVSLPPAVAGPSGMNALAHSVEALYGPGANPVVRLLALESIGALHRGLPLAVATPDDLDGRAEVLYGAYLAGVALASTGTALHHKTCHVLGGMFGLDHGAMNAVVLPHAMAYNGPAIGAVLDDMGAVLGVDGPAVPGAVFDLARAIGAPAGLGEIGMPADGLDEATDRVVTAAAANIRPPDHAGIRHMLDDAYRGRRPGP